MYISYLDGRPVERKYHLDHSRPFYERTGYLKDGHGPYANKTIRKRRKRSTSQAAPNYRPRDCSPTNSSTKPLHFISYSPENILKKTGKHNPDTGDTGGSVMKKVQFRY